MNSGWAERVDVEVGELRLDAAEQFDVPVEGEFGVHPALHQDLGAADRDDLPDLLQQFLVLEGVGVVVALIAAEGTEGALRGADVGVVDVPVDHVGPDRVAVDRPASPVRESAEIGDRHAVPGVERLLGRQPGLAGDQRVLEAGIERDRRSVRWIGVFGSGGFGSDHRRIPADDAAVGGRSGFDRC